tara:strand:+ start:367 stop:525 length:159 start_codon:yes stop_codon:yes gene_type:complete
MRGLMEKGVGGIPKAKSTSSSSGKTDEATVLGATLLVAVLVLQVLSALMVER